jgi:uncharacterized protein
VKHVLCRCLIVPSIFLFSIFLSSCRIEDKFIFHPSAYVADYPHSAGLAFEEVYFDTADNVRLNGWFVPHPQAQSTLVWFHGNAGNIGHRVANLKLLHHWVKVHVFIFDYRGYGKSQGRISEAGSYLDGAAAIDYLRRNKGIEPERMIFFGRSLGAAIATEMTTRVTPSGLILESPFTSIRDMARAIFPLLPVGPILRTRYDIMERIRRIRAPLLVLHGDRDGTIPWEQGKRVFDAAPEPKQFHTIGGAAHNDTFVVGGPHYFKILRDFVAAVESRRDKALTD